MPLRQFLRLGITLAAIGLIARPFALRAQDDDSHHGRKYKTPPLSSRIQVTVLRDSSGKPIQDAHVIFHPIEGDRDRGALELKTNEDGKIVIDVIPIGDTVRLQVIANGFQTYGQDYKIDKSEMSMEIRMKRPGGQYSIYKNSGAAPAKPANPPPYSSDKPSGNSNAPDDKPNSGQPQQQPK
jgi:5-hydroxyisourate hydrolase-like protein (transthyretin family)